MSNNLSLSNAAASALAWAIFNANAAAYVRSRPLVATVEITDADRAWFRRPIIATER